MPLVEHKCYTANCDGCRVEFFTEIQGIETYYFLSKIELEDAFFDKDWKNIDEKYYCDKCLINKEN